MKTINNATVDPVGKTGKKRINSKQKGNSYERWLARFFREHFGFRFCRTSRQASRLLDDCGIDLSGLPFMVSAKSGYKAQRPKPDQILSGMATQTKNAFASDDPIHHQLAFLFHRIDGHSPFHHIVSMTFDDWVKIMTVYERYKNFANERNIEAAGTAG